MALSVLIHLAIVGGLLLTWVEQAHPPELQPVEVALVDIQSLFPKPKSEPPAGAKADKPKPAPKRSSVRPPPPRRAPSPLVLARNPTPAIGPSLSESALAGAADAEGEGGGGGGAGGGPCNMAARLQAGLRKDPLVLAAVARLGGRAVMVWDGRWIQNEGEDGGGLSAVREAVQWEIGFAPPACREQVVHGLVKFSFRQPPGAGRLVIGTDRWTWSDLLGLKGQAATREAPRP